MDKVEETFYRPPDVARRPALEYSTQELRERKELSEVILRMIRTEAIDLAELERRASSLATALSLIREMAASMNLDDLERRLAGIATGLKVIREDEILREVKADH